MIFYWRILRRCFAALGWDFCPTRLDEKNVSEVGQGRGLGVYCNWKGVEKLRLAFASWRDSAPFHFLTHTNPYPAFDQLENEPMNPNEPFFDDSRQARI